MLLFRSEEGVRNWCAARGREAGAILSLKEAWRAAVAWFGDALDPEFRGHTPEDTIRRFRQAGFTGAFWEA